VDRILVKETFEYSDDSIQVLEGLDAVRKRPGMYIGSTDHRGLHHLVFEIVDNAVDEALSGFGEIIKVTIHNDNSISVEDSGRGIPTGKHSTEKSTMEVIFTVLHEGGKCGEGRNNTSRGFHGVGATVVIGLAESMDFTTFRDGYSYFQGFENGGNPADTLEKQERTNKTGTIIHFKPASTIFTSPVFDLEIRSEEHTSELQSRFDLVCRLLLEKKK